MTNCLFKAFDLLTSDICIYLLISLGLNITPIVIVFLALKIQDLNLGDCSAILGRWMLVNAVFCSFHILAAVYITTRMRRSTNNEEENHENNLEGGDAESAALDRRAPPKCFRWICENVFTSLYTLYTCITTFWLARGIWNLIRYKDDQCNIVAVNYTIDALSCGFVYLLLNMAGYVCFLLCLSKRKQPQSPSS